MPKDYTNHIGQVMADSVAEKAGIKANDEIISINGQRLNSWSEITGVIHNSSEKQLEIELKRDNKTIFVTVTPQYDPEREVGIIGITPRDVIWERINILSGIAKGFTQTYLLTVEMIRQLGY